MDSVSGFMFDARVHNLVQMLVYAKVSPKGMEGNIGLKHIAEEWGVYLNARHVHDDRYRISPTGISALRRSTSVLERRIGKDVLFVTCGNVSVDVLDVLGF